MSTRRIALAVSLIAALATQSVHADEAADAFPGQVPGAPIDTLAAPAQPADSAQPASAETQSALPYGAGFEARQRRVTRSIARHAAPVMRRGRR